MAVPMNLAMWFLRKKFRDPVKGVGVDTRQV